MPDRRPATRPPARGSKWVWILGAILLVAVVLLGVRAFLYGGSDPDYERPGSEVLTPADEAAAGTNGQASPDSQPSD